MSLMLIGEFEVAIDAKNRLSIPAALRESINPDQDGTNFVLILGANRHLCLYPDQYYRRLLAKMNRSPLPTRQQRKLDLFFAMARMVKPDAQGRVVLPEKSMQRAVIAKNVTLVGAMDYIEIVPTDEWEQRLDQDMDTYGEVLNDVAEMMEQTGDVPAGHGE